MESDAKSHRCPGTSGQGQGPPPEHPFVSQDDVSQHPRGHWWTAAGVAGHLRGVDGHRAAGPAESHRRRRRRPQRPRHADHQCPPATGRPGRPVVGAFAFGLASRWLDLVPPSLASQAVEPLGGRVSPNILTLGVGLAAGAAAAFGLATEGQVTIVGVMIAAALLPTAATAGIALAWARPVGALGALLLLSLALLAVNVGGAAMLWNLGFRPDDVDVSIFSLESAGQGAIVLGTVLLVLVAATLVGVAFVHQAHFERSVNSAVADVDRK
ncbi:DUF389 domain-containing protein [Halobacteriales archaeon Cl-PHB]